MRIRFAIASAFLVCLASPERARAVDVVGGQTNVVLDAGLLASAAGLNLSSVSPDVISPGSLPGSVAFGINARDAAARPTTFSYNPATFPAGGSFAGAIEHQGSVFFNADTVEVGDFQIGFDGTRAGTLGGAASGFYVASTTGIAAILFDLGVTSADAQQSSLSVGANLLVSPEFGSFLLTNGLASTNLQGADVGDALVAAAAVPEPSAVILALLATGALATVRRRSCLN